MSDWVELTKVNGEIEANVVAGSLENEGIPTRLQKTSGVWRYGASDAFVLIAIYVPEDRVTDAMELLDHPAGAPDDVEGADEALAPDADPFARSGNMRWWVAALVLIGLMVALFQSQVLDLLR